MKNFSQLGIVPPANEATPLMKGDIERMARRRYQRGTVFKRGTRNQVWVGQWRESVIDAGGQEKRVIRKEVLGTTKDFPTERLAKRELETRISPVNSLSYRGLRSSLFKDFVKTWTDSALPNLKASSQPPIRSQINKWFLPYFGKVNMRDMGGAMIQQFLQDSKLSNKSKLNLVTTLRMMWNSAIGWNYATHDPFKGLVLPDVDKCEQPNFTIEQVQKIIAAAKPPYDVILWLIAQTGIRRGEVCALNVGHISIENRLIAVRDSRFGKHITANKSRRPRVFSISPMLADALVPFVTGRASIDPLFLTPVIVTSKAKKIVGGRRLHPDNFVKRVLKPILEELGLSGALHAMRHGNATMLDRLNVPMKLRQERFGHVDPATTMGYTHLVGEDDRKLAAQLDEILMPERCQVASVVSAEVLRQMEVDCIQ